MDIKMGIQAHLVINKCGNGDEFSLKESDVSKFASGMTDGEYSKVLTARSEKAIKDREQKLHGDPIKKGDEYLVSDDGSDKEAYKPEIVDKDIDTAKKPTKTNEKKRK